MNNYGKVKDVRKSPLECHSSNFQRQEPQMDAEMSTKI